MLLVKFLIRNTRQQTNITGGLILSWPYSLTLRHVPEKLDSFNVFLKPSSGSLLEFTLMSLTNSTAHVAKLTAF